MERKEKKIILEELTKERFNELVTLKGYYNFNRKKISEGLVITGIKKQSLSFQYTILKYLSINNCILETLFMPNTGTNSVTINQSVIEKLLMSNIKIGTDITIIDSDITELDLRDSKFRNMHIDKTVIKNIFLKGAIYDHLYIENQNLAIAAHLSQNGIIIPACKKNDGWLVQGS